MNTKIDYLYRDAGNYKLWNQCIISGELTKEQQNQIMDSLHEGEFFIPRKIPLPEKRFDKWDDTDHIWFELNEDSFSFTEEEPTVALSSDDLVKGFLKNKGRWEEDLVYSVELAKASVEKHHWTITDPDCMQVRRLADYGNNDVFELAQIDTLDLYDKDIYMIAHGDVNLSEYTDKEKDIFLRMYGYANMDELIKLVGSCIEANGQLAEMIFETYNTDYHVDQYDNWKEAVEQIEQYTQLDLGDYKNKPKQMEDYDYLSSFILVEDELSDQEERFTLGMIASDGTTFYISEKYGDVIRGTELTVDSAINRLASTDYLIFGGYAENGLYFIFDESGAIGKEELEALCDGNPVYISEKMNKWLIDIGLKEEIEKSSLNDKMKAATDKYINSGSKDAKTNDNDLSL